MSIACAQLMITASRRSTMRHSEPGGIRIRFVTVIAGAVLLLGYLAFRASNSSPASASSDPVTAPPPQSVVVAKRYGTEPAVVPVDPVADPAVATLPAHQAAREAVPSLVAQEVIARVGQLDFFAGGLSPQK